MRKLLLFIIIVLLLAGCMIIMKNGFSMGGFEINSLAAIQNLGNELDRKIQQGTELTTITFNNTNKELTNAVKELQNKRIEYEAKLDSIGAEKLAELLTTNRHEMQFLWTKIGNYASNNGLRLTLDLRASASGLNGEKDLEFTIEGMYRNVTNFLYSLENDDSLQFKIEHFKLVPISVVENGPDGTTTTISKLKATFSVKGLNVVLG